MAKCIQTKNIFGYPLESYQCLNTDSEPDRGDHAVGHHYKTCGRHDSLSMQECIGHYFMPDSNFNQLLVELLDKGINETRD